MSNLTWWLLFGSIFLVLLIGFSIYFILFFKARKIIRKNKKNNFNSEIFLQRKEIGDLLFKLKERLMKNGVRTTDDVLEYLINTILINSYNNIYINNIFSSYEAITFNKLLNLKINYNNGNINKEEIIRYKLNLDDFNKREVFKEDFILVFEIDNIKDIYDKYYKALKPDGLLVIIHDNKKSYRELKRYLNLLKPRYEHKFLTKTLTLIVK